MTYLYTGQSFDKCKVCTYEDTWFTEEPCKSCRNRVKPKEPVRELWIENAKYVLADSTEDSQ